MMAVLKIDRVSKTFGSGELAVQTLKPASFSVGAGELVALLGYLDIVHRADSLPANLSGGEQQRVAIGRALANEPPLILADEPTAALDTERCAKVMALLRKIARERRSAVITITHDHRMIDGSDTVYHLDDGRLSRSAQTAAQT
jgi:putative ABC transport system ATP-binding protein